MAKKRFNILRKFNRAVTNPITRRFVAGRVPFCSLIYHYGRRSGKAYTTPVMAVYKDKQIFIPLTYGPDTDWYLNIQANGFCRVKINGKVYAAIWPEQVDAEGAAEAFPNNVTAPIKMDRFLKLTTIAEG